MLTQLLHKAATERFPAEPLAAPPTFRGRIALRPDVCIGCSLCSVACPTSCVDMAPSEAEVPRGDRVVHRKRRPNVRLADCIRCGACEDVCPVAPKAIYLSQERSGPLANKDEVVS